MNRREFLKLGLTLAIGGFAMTADAKTQISPRKIDFHAHAILPGYIDALKRLKIEESIEEFHFATEKLGALGVKLASNSDGVYLGDEKLDPIFAELNKSGAN
ncbi:MAG: hypothetical protein IKG61_09795 [Selenomonadaceae bacterium]|nr:hypothetical protein [Selenomonadaceae bacterium]MBR3746879.1 hypothetical protein [Selenomonadaceae bacterium]